MFSFLTQPKYPRAAIGIERGRVTSVAVKRESRGCFRVEQAATVEVSASAFEPNFTAQNILNPVEFRESLHEAATAAGLLGQTKWSVSLPSQSARTAILSLENTGRGRTETDEILDWKAEQAFGASASALRVARHKIAGDGEGKIKYFATAIQLSVIDEYESVFESLGWKAGLMLPRAIGESMWLLGENDPSDAFLISTQEEGFTAFLLRNGEPVVVRSVTCGASEKDDEIYRLLLFYNDRFSGSDGMLERLLVVGRGILPAKLREISADALGRSLSILSAEDAGLSMPGGGLSFDDIAGPAGLASLGFN